MILITVGMILLVTGVAIYRLLHVGKRDKWMAPDNSNLG